MIDPEPTPYLNRPYQAFYRVARAFAELLVRREIHSHHVHLTANLLTNLLSKLFG
ncbi:MAG TPA: hypothetical protein VD713_04200 [Sphingomonadales bacterium]|nr:hypothetical protein [Sphingomonadales bacterium]